MAKKIILIIDDNPDIIEIYTVRLEAAGYEVRFSLSGEEALRVTQEFKPDLIILDISMPGMDGIEVGLRFRDSDILRNVPIIMATAHSDRERMMKVITQVNAQAYLVKPFDPQVMLKTIARILNDYRSET